MDASHHMVMGVEVMGTDHYIQLTSKITDHEVNGAFRYKAWTHHRERVLQRLSGWHLIASGPDFATFNIPNSIVAAAATERQNKIPKEERQYWGDKSDFCRCLETVLSEMEPRSEKTSSAYMLFCSDKRQEHKEAGHARHLDVKDLGLMWKVLSEEERKPWMERAVDLKHSSAGLGMPRNRTKSKTSGIVGGTIPVQPLPPVVQQCCSEAGLDSIDAVVRLIEGKQPMELLGYERRLRVIMNRLHELQFQISTSMPPKKRPKRTVDQLSAQQQQQQQQQQQLQPSCVGGMVAWTPQAETRE
mmetsp:Transcript_62945/g.101799  ORF Transcript_62945/g.101799 Transcript_62945/m.101799 type:complete len:301 (+) Transcript_62945:157-1059(+)